jgi:hypothetical protein
VLQYDKEENDTASNGKVQSFQEGKKGASGKIKLSNLLLNSYDIKRI